MNKPEKIECLIVGSGPAGYTAAIYAARAGLKPVMITGMKQGGQLMDTTDVENYPGYPDGIMGPEMMKDFEKQAVRFGTDVRFGYVTNIEVNERPFKVTVDDKFDVYASSVIIATGATAKWLGLESEIRLRDIGGGVSACAVCDGFFYKKQDVIVVGGGDTAAEEALYLAKLCTNVHLLVRRDEMRASKIMQTRVEQTENITIHWNTETVEVLGDEFVTAAKVINNKTQEVSEIPVTGFFVAIGHKPNTDIFVDKLDMDSEGYLITKGDSTVTNVEGIFACGDVQDKLYRQAVTAAGTGCMAALELERFLAEKEFESSQVIGA